MGLSISNAEERAEKQTNQKKRYTLSSQNSQVWKVTSFTLTHFWACNCQLCLKLRYVRCSDLTSEVSSTLRLGQLLWHVLSLPAWFLLTLKHFLINVWAAPLQLPLWYASQTVTWSRGLDFSAAWHYLQTAQVYCSVEEILRLWPTLHTPTLYTSFTNLHCFPCHAMQKKCCNCKWSKKWRYQYITNALWRNNRILYHVCPNIFNCTYVAH